MRPHSNRSIRIAALSIRSLGATLALVLALWGSGPVEGHGGHAGPAAKHVPVIETGTFDFGARSSVQLIAKPCSGLPVPLTEIARQAATVWSRLTPVSIEIRQGSCSVGPARGNGRSELYLSANFPDATVVGRYSQWINPDTGVLLEEDVEIARSVLGRGAEVAELNRREALYAAILHELGHALGLDDAYKAWPNGCGWSVMLSLCAGFPERPTPKDLAAIRHVFGTAGKRERDISQADPALARFDANDNGRIDDAEFLRVVERWTHGELPHETMTAVMDAWIAQRPIRGASLAGLPDGSRPTRSAVRVYTLDGREVYAAACRPNARTQAVRALQREIGNAAHARPGGPYVLVQRDCDIGRVRRDVVVLP